jgi:hypothetical protein
MCLLSSPEDNYEASMSKERNTQTNKGNKKQGVLFKK